MTIEGETLTGSAYRRYTQEDLERTGVTITNDGNQPTEVKVTATAIRLAPPASANGFTIDVGWYLPDGTVFDPPSARSARTTASSSS